MVFIHLTSLFWPCGLKQWNTEGISRQITIYILSSERHLSEIRISSISLCQTVSLSLWSFSDNSPPPSTPHPPNLSLTLCWNHTRRRPENCSHDTSVFIKKISWNNYMFWPLTRVTRLQCRLYNYFWCRKHISQQCVVKRIWSKYLGDYKSLMPLYFSFTFLWVNVQWCLN